MKIRSGFVSNSSSASFVVIKDTNLFFPELPETVVVDGDFGETKFGWGPRRCDGFGDRVIFAYLQTQCIDSRRQGRTWQWMLENVLRDNTSAKKFVWKISDEYGNEYFDWGYIDHQSSASEGQNTEMFENEETLKNFLFSKDSFIMLDNDNY